MAPTQVKSSNEGISFEVEYKDEKGRFEIPVLGKQHVSVFLPAILCGVEMGMSLEECVNALKKFKMPPGRMSLIDGINGSLIIDSSYNASPFATEGALEILKDFDVGVRRGAPLPGRRIAALGNMNELGRFSEEMHYTVGKQAAEVADVLVTVGELARGYGKAALDSGFKKENLYEFVTNLEAGTFLKSHLKKGDIVLVKGSQNKVRLERTVKMIMAHPERAGELLVRQGKGWE